MSDLGLAAPWPVWLERESKRETGATAAKVLMNEWRSVAHVRVGRTDAYPLELGRESYETLEGWLG